MLLYDKSRLWLLKNENFHKFFVNFAKSHKGEILSYRNAMKPHGRLLSAVYDYKKIIERI